MRNVSRKRPTISQQKQVGNAVGTAEVNIASPVWDNRADVNPVLKPT